MYRTQVVREKELWLFPRRWTWWVQVQIAPGSWNPVGGWGRCFTKRGAARRSERELGRFAGVMPRG
jgi:hypothetical protein